MVLSCCIVQVPIPQQISMETVRTYLKRQIRNIAIGAVFMYLTAKIDYRFWKKFYTFAYVVAFMLCILVYVPGIGTDSHGSSRWLALGPIQFQPSEISEACCHIVFGCPCGKIIQKHGKSGKSCCDRCDIASACRNCGRQVAKYSSYHNGYWCLYAFCCKSKIFAFCDNSHSGCCVCYSIYHVCWLQGRQDTGILHPETAGDKGYQTLMGLYAIGSGGLLEKGLREPAETWKRSGITK